MLVEGDSFSLKFSSKWRMTPVVTKMRGKRLSHDSLFLSEKKNRKGKKMPGEQDRHTISQKLLICWLSVANVMTFVGNI